MHGQNLCVYVVLKLHMIGLHMLKTFDFLAPYNILFIFFMI